MLPRKEYLQKVSNKMASVAGLLSNSKGEYLFVKPTYKDNWMPVGGNIDPNEHPTVSCIREFKEEVNLDIKVGSLLQISSRIVEEGEEKFDLITILFEVSCSDLSSLKIDGVEIEKYVWLNLEEANEILTDSWRERLENLRNDVMYFEF